MSFLELCLQHGLFGNCGIPELEVGLLSPNQDPFLPPFPNSPLLPSPPQLPVTQITQATL